MNLTAKITAILSQKHFVQVDDLKTYANEQQIRVALLQSGKNNFHRVVCSLLAKNITNQLLIAGSFLLQDILDLQKSGKFQIHNIIPLGVFDQNYELDEFLTKIAIEPTPKKGIIFERKVKTRLLQKQGKILMKKKQSEMKNNGNKLMKGSLNKQNKSEKMSEIKKEKSKLKIKQQNSMKDQQLKIEKQKIKEAEKLKAKDNTESQDEAKLLEIFSIKPKNQEISCEKQKKVNKQEEKKTEVISKISDLQLNEEEQYELILKKQKMKAENKNINIMEKVQKKTTDRLPVSNTITKPKATVVQPQIAKAGNQSTLFRFLKKNEQ